MGTSFYEQHDLSAPSFNSMGDSFYEQQPQHHNERYVKSSPLKKEKRKKKRPSSNKKEKHTALKNSLQQFLVDSNLEDLHFTQQHQHSTNIVKPKRENADTPSLSSSVDLFDRNALAAVGKSSKRQHKSKKKKGARKPQNQQPKEQRQDQSLESFKLFQTSLDKIFDDSNDVADDDDKSEGSLSLSDLKTTEEPKKQAPRRRRSSRQSKALRPSSGSCGQIRTGIRPRSSIGNSVGTSDKCSNTSLNNIDLMRGLNRLDKQVRRDRMKKEYHRSPTGDIRSENSVSTMSTKSSYVSRPYKRTGFEGGALNAILGNESFARIASKGGEIASLSGSGTFGSSLSDDKFQRERKARQDKILDMVTRRKALPEASNPQEEAMDNKQQPQNQTIVDSDSTHASVFASDTTENPEMKKKGLVKKMKKAVRKSTKMSKSEAKVVANTVAESSKQRSTRKGYIPAPEVSERGEEHPVRREGGVKTPTHSNKNNPFGSATSPSTVARSSKKPKKGKRPKKPNSFTSLESPTATSQKVKKAKKAKKGKGSSSKSFTSFESTSPLFQRPSKGRAVATGTTADTTKVKPRITGGLNDSMSEMFPEFQLAENSKVIWWDI